MNVWRNLLIPSDKPRIGQQLREWSVIIVVAVVIAVVVRTFFLQQFYISGPSMEPTMYQDNRVLVDKISYRFREPRRGEVIVFDRVTVSQDVVQHDDLIKRVIGVPGDRVEIRSCDVIVNGRIIDEKYLDPSKSTESDPADRCRMTDMNEISVENDHYFVLGDNRVESFDSRAFGTIRGELIVGRAMAIVWPLGMFNIL
jgi:signal peptidase I